MNDLLSTKCGRFQSTTGKPYTLESLAQHELDCPRCNPNYNPHNPPGTGKRKKHADNEIDIDPLGVCDDDAPDGAYWAMHNEFYGWP